jgi:hypothetical protein
MVASKWSKNRYVRTIRRRFDRPFFHRLRYSRVTGVSSFLRGSSSFEAAQPVFETLLLRILTVMRAWRVLRRYATELHAQNKRLKFQSVARVPDLSYCGASSERWLDRNLRFIKRCVTGNMRSSSPQMKNRQLLRNR